MSESQSADPPFQGELTVIWETEKRDINHRLEALELDVKDLQNKLQLLLEAFRTKPQPAPPQPAPGAGIGQAIPKAHPSPTGVSSR